MAFSFNQFFGLEKVINQHPDLVIIYGFAGLVLGLIALSLISIVLNRLHFRLIIDHFFAPLMCSMLVSLLVAILPTLVLYFLANNVSGVKLLYCWITIFAGVTFFCFFNFPMISKWASISKR